MRTGTGVGKSLASAWEATRNSLFRPFGYEKWLALAFCAWLANIGGGWLKLNLSGNPFSTFNKSRQGSHAGSGLSQLQDSLRDMGFQNQGRLPDIKMPDFQGVIDFFRGMAPYVSILLVAMLLLLALGIFLVVMWVVFRGRFIFLDNVMNDKVEIAGPWRSLAGEANSAFLWFLCFLLAVIFLETLIIAPTVYLSFPWIKACVAHKTLASIDPWTMKVLFAGVFLLVLLSLASWLVQTLFNEFVLPVMLVKRVGATKAWGIFLRVLLSGKWAFAKYLVAYAGIRISVGISIYLVCFMTCCCCGIGFIILSVPYVWAVFTLPILFFYRAFPVAFLGGLDDAYALQKSFAESGTASKS